MIIDFIIAELIVGAGALLISLIICVAALISNYIERRRK